MPGRPLWQVRVLSPFFVVLQRNNRFHKEQIILILYFCLVRKTFFARRFVTFMGPNVGNQSVDYL